MPKYEVDIRIIADETYEIEAECAAEAEEKAEERAEKAAPLANSVDVMAIRETEK